MQVAKFGKISEFLSKARRGLLFCGCIAAIWAIATAATAQSLSCSQSPAQDLARVREPATIRTLSDEFSQQASALATSGDSAGAIRCFSESARFAMLIVDLEAADRSLGEALKIARRQGQSDALGEVISNRFLLAYQEAQPEKTKARRDEIVELMPSLEKSKAVALLALGLYEYDYGTIGKAREYFSQAEQIAVDTDDPRIICEILIYNGYSALQNDDPFESLKKAESALSFAQKYDYPRGRANANFAIAYSRVVVGDSQIALDSLKTAFDDLLPEADWVEKAVNLNLRASIYKNLGRSDVARPMFEQAIGYYERSGNLRGRMNSLLAIGDIEFENDNTDQAVQIYADVIGIAAGLKDDFQAALVNERLGDLAFARRDYTAAVEKYRLAKEGYVRKDVRLARVDHSMALAYERIGDLSKAQSLIESAAETNKRTRNPSELARNYYDLARLAANSGDFKKAEERILESISITDRLHSGIDSSNLRTSYFSQVHDRYQFYSSLLMSGKISTDSVRDTETALAVIEQSKARTFRDILALAGSDFRRDANPETVRREKELLTLLNLKQSRLTGLLTDGGAESEIKRLEGEIVKMEFELDSVRLEFKKQSPGYAAIKNPEPFNVERFQREVLREDDLLLEFSLAEDASYLWIIGKNDFFAYTLPPRREIEARVNKLRSLLIDRRLREGESPADYQLRLANAETEYKFEARLLSNELLGQIPTGRLAGKKLIVAADGRLHYFPLGVLPMPGATGEEPILLSNEVVYTPSASSLSIFRMERPTERAPDMDLLVFADPVFSKTDERIAVLNGASTGFTATILSPFRAVESLESLPRLPASEIEAESISDVVGEYKTTVRAGFAANRDSVLNGGVERYKILHFATHGLIDERRPELSGILLSLFDDTGKQTDGGFIRMQDVYGLSLKSDVVVLSACETGVGREIRGEGVMSLNNAFLQAGAKSVVSSLWKVDDAATKDLMTEFYRGLAEDGLTTPAALRQAQITMYRDSRYGSPFYWAAFTASGDNNARVEFTSRSGRYAAIAACLAAAFVVALAALRIFRRKTDSRANQR